MDLPGVEALQVQGHISHFSDTLQGYCVHISMMLQLFVVNEAGCVFMKHNVSILWSSKLKSD